MILIFINSVIGIYYCIVLNFCILIKKVFDKFILELYKYDGVDKFII